MKRKTLRERAYDASLRGRPLWSWLAGYRACQADARRKSKQSTGHYGPKVGL